MRSFTCPACARPLYNRRRATCEFCGKTIPASLLLSNAQQSRIAEIRHGDRRRATEPGRDGASFGASNSTFDFGGGSFDSGGGCDGGGGGCDCG